MDLTQMFICLYSTVFGLHVSVLQIKASQQSITTNLWLLIAHICHVMIIVTGGFSKKSFFIIIFQKQPYTDVLQNGCYQKICNICRKTLWPATLFQPCPKRDFNTGVFPYIILQNIYKQLFYRTPPAAAFVSLIK